MRCKFDQILVYRNEQTFYLIACMKGKQICRVIEIGLNDKAELQQEKMYVKLHGSPYSFQDAKVKAAILIQGVSGSYDKNVNYSTLTSFKDNEINDNKQLTEVLQKCFIMKAYGIIGCPKFLHENYLLMVKERQLEAILTSGELIYSIKSVEMLSFGEINGEPQNLAIEQQYVNFFKLNNLSDGNHYFSPYYDLTNSFQSSRHHLNTNFAQSQQLIQENQQEKNNQNIQQNNHQQIPLKDVNYNNLKEVPIELNVQDRFLWNSYILQPLLKVCDIYELILPIIQGCVVQKNFQIKQSIFSMIVVSRRSRFHTGPRYLQRGINAESNVANEVETEEILFIQDKKIFSSYILHRGSIPFSWGHENLYNFKPDIIIHDQDKNSDFELTNNHFKNMKQRYDGQIFCLNTVKTDTNHESKLIKKFEDYLKQLPEQMQFIKYTYYDFFQIYNRNEYELICELQMKCKFYLEKTNFFFEKKSEIRKIQKGIVRLNCVDCLDRTNNCIACFGTTILNKQLQLFGLQNSKFQEGHNVINELMSFVFEIFGYSGDCIANQYGGSPAFHRAMIAQNEDGEWQTEKHNIAVVACQRYYQNTIGDYDKQKQLWLFHGNFKPSISNELHIFNDFYQIENVIKESKYLENNHFNWKGKCTEGFDFSKQTKSYNLEKINKDLFRVLLLDSKDKNLNQNDQIKWIKQNSKEYFTP